MVDKLDYIRKKKAAIAFLMVTVIILSIVAYYLLANVSFYSPTETLPKVIWCCGVPL